MAGPRWRLTILLTVVVVSADIPSLADSGSLSTDGPAQQAQLADPGRSIRAERTNSPMTIDGLLTEDVWQRAESATGFIQREPDEGRPATEPTQVRIAYDDRALYVGVLCLDSRAELVRAPSYKRDYEGFLAGDYFGMVFDTFRDGQSGFGFGTNPAGAEDDWQFAGEGAYSNTNWDGVWTVRTSRDKRGWSAEFEIPFKTLRFRPGSDGVWGVNFWRYLARRAEHSHWAPVPRQFRVERVSMAGELRGLTLARPGRNIQLKPYASAATEHFVSQTRDALNGGFDLKYSLTPSLTLDATHRTDFSHVEVDTQKVNLTRFPLLFPEKRDFFLENSGVFQIIHSGFSGDLVPFFSRRIGLSEAGRPVPVTGGVRLGGRLGLRTSLGGLYMRTDELKDDPVSGETVPPTDFVIGRVRRESARGEASAQSLWGGGGRGSGADSLGSTRRRSSGRTVGFSDTG